MSAILVFPESDPNTRLAEAQTEGAIAEILRSINVRFERWEASTPLPPGAGQEQVIEAYRADVERLKAEGGYQSVDVVRLVPDPNDTGWPAKAAGARKKFLEEHTHAEDEVRFFVEGSGMFYLRANGKIHAVLCAQGDLISVPAGIRHWFDMGTSPKFCAIRLFTTPEGWVAEFTGEPIARSFPDYDTLTQAVAA
jgi:1,2-dihydroxy-3-keto-5-methylthiopentene dioxygenase